MIEPIVDIFKDKIETLLFAEKVAGIVKTAPVQISDGENRTFLKRFPVECQTTIEDCKTGRYKDLIPNNAYQSIIYFEDNGISLVSVNGTSFRFRANTTLVGWLNLAKLGQTSCSISAAIIATLIKNLPQNHQNLPPVYQNIVWNITNILPKSAAIFSRYSYSEEVNQYLLYPFDYFALSMSIEFSVNSNCIEDFLPSDGINCIKH